MNKMPADLLEHEADILALPTCATWSREWLAIKTQVQRRKTRRRVLHGAAITMILASAFIWLPTSPKKITPAAAPTFAYLSAAEALPLSWDLPPEKNQFAPTWRVNEFDPLSMDN